MKKQEISRENIFSSVGRVTVVVHSKVGTDKHYQRFCMPINPGLYQVFLPK